MRLDAGSIWATANVGDVLLREGKAAEALENYKKVALAGGGKRLDAGVAALELYLDNRRGKELEDAARKDAAETLKELDPEPKYLIAAELAYVGQKDSALQLLRSAVQGNYCQVYALDHDPVFASLRSDSEFASIRAAAVDCQKRFMAHRQEKGSVPQN